MNKTTVLFFTTLLTLVSCGSSEETFEQKVDRANENIKRMNSISKELNSDYNVNIGSFDTSAQADNASSKSYNTCKKIKSLLSEYSKLGRETESIADNDVNIYSTDGVKMSSLISNADSINSDTTCTAPQSSNTTSSAQSSASSAPTLYEMEEELENNSIMKFKEEYSHEEGETIISLVFTSTVTYEDLKKSRKALNKFINDVTTNYNNPSEEMKAKTDIAKKTSNYFKAAIAAQDLKFLALEITQSFMNDTANQNIEEIKQKIHAYKILSTANTGLIVKKNVMTKDEIRKLDDSVNQISKTLEIIEQTNQENPSLDGNIDHELRESDPSIDLKHDKKKPIDGIAV